MDSGRPRAARALRAASWFEWGIPILAALLVGSALLRDFGRYGGRDWDQGEADLYSARHSLLVERELPLWMPYRAGGHDAFADPQSLWPSPLGLLSLVFGVPGGIRAFYALAAAAGALGALRLGAHLGLTGWASALAAVLLFLTTVLGLHAAAGMPTHTLGLVILPWLVLCLLRRDRASVLWGGALLALALYGGDVNHFIFHPLYLGAVAVVLAALTRSPRPLARLALTVLAAAVFAAPKLLPSALLALDAPRLTDARGRALTPRVLAHALLDRDAPRFLEAPLREWVGLTPAGNLASQMSPAGPVLRPETMVHWANVGSYLGPLPLLLACGGAALLARRLRARFDQRAARGPVATDAPVALLALVAGGALFLWLAFGSNATPSAWLALHELPVFASLRAPARLILYPVFCLALLAGLALDSLQRATGGRWGARPAAAGAAALVLVVLLDVHPPARRAYAQTFVEPDRGLPRAAEFVQMQVRGCRARCTFYGPQVAPFAKAGVGVTNGYNAVPTTVYAVPREAVDRYRGEAFTLGGGGRVSNLRVTARRIELDVEADRSDTLVINQNWAPGWRVASPEHVFCVRHTDGRIAVPVQAGRTHLLLRYTSPGLGAGLLVGAGGLPVLLLLLRRFGTDPGEGAEKSGAPRGSTT